MQPIYLDGNATTKPAEEVVAAVTESLREGWANPSSIHRPGQAVRRRVEAARASVAELLDCQEREVVFLAGGTEAADLAVRGTLAALPDRRVLVTSRLEHGAVRELAGHLEARGAAEVVWLPNDERGVVSADALRETLAARAQEIALVAVMWANNETGVVQPVEAIGSLCREHGVRFFTDGTQYVGKGPVALSRLPVDLMGFAAHKFHGPKGVGGLFVRRGVRLEAQTVGPQERGRRGGTENVPGIVGLGAAARLAGDWLAGGGPQRLEALRDAFERRLIDAIDGVAVNGAGAPRIWSTSNLAFDHVEAEPMLLMLSERGVCASGGAACASGSLEPSPVLEAMGLAPSRVAGSLRFSLCRETTADELDRAADTIADAAARLRALHAAAL